MVVGQIEVMRNQKASTFGFGERENVWSYRNIGKIWREGEKEGVSLYTTLLFFFLLFSDGDEVSHGKGLG